MHRTSFSEAQGSEELKAFRCKIKELHKGDPRIVLFVPDFREPMMMQARPLPYQGAA
jgi:hypothetical protein